MFFSVIKILTIKLLNIESLCTFIYEEITLLSNGVFYYKKNLKVSHKKGVIFLFYVESGKNIKLHINVFNHLKGKKKFIHFI